MSARTGPPAPSYRNPVLPLLVVGAVLAVVIVLILRGRGGSGEIEGVETFPSPARDHQEGSIAYPQAPPAGGVHNSGWQNCGIYDTQVANENAVHSLEHGAVWITYRPDLDAAEVEKLRALVRGRPYTLLAPYAYGPLDTAVAAVAWGVRLRVDRADDPRLARFVARYANGPQTPEPGAVCSGAIGAPVG